MSIQQKNNIQQPVSKQTKPIRATNVQAPKQNPPTIQMKMGPGDIIQDPEINSPKARPNKFKQQDIVISSADKRRSQTKSRQNTNRVSMKKTSVQRSDQKSGRPGSQDLISVGRSATDQRSSFATMKQEGDLMRQILYEPSACINIPTVKEELDRYKHMGILQKPVEIYLDHCLRYAKSNLKKDSIMITDYEFTAQDFHHQVVNPYLFGNSADIKHVIKSWAPDEIRSLFTTEELKLFTDIVFVGEAQRLIVKTWQKVRFNLEEFTRVKSSGGSPEMARTKSSSQRRAQYTKTRAGTVNIENMTAVKKLQAQATSNIDQQRRNTLVPVDSDYRSEKNTFYIKTIQFYDHLGQPIGQPILTEQIFGEFDDYRLQDTSYVKHGAKIYFFRRIFNFDKKRQGSSLQENLPISELADSKLQLFSFDLATKEMKGDYGCQFQEYVENDKPQKVREDKDDFASKPQFNLQFSTEFGPEARANANLADVNQFFENQFLSIQQYHNRDQKFLKIQICQLRARDSAPYDLSECVLFQTEDTDNMFSQNSDANAPLQMLNHITEKLQGGKKQISFLISNIHSLIKIVYQARSKSSSKSKRMKDGKKDIEFFTRNSGDIFLKLHNTNGVLIQGINLQKRDADGNQASVMQYFFVDQRNQIQILYPNYKQKVEKLKIIELISEQAEINQGDFNLYKKIKCVDLRLCRKMNVVQKIEDLRKILIHDDITRNNLLTFCQDQTGQTLYISNPEHRKIVTISMREHNCEVCKESNNPELQSKLVRQSSRILEEKQQNDANTLIRQVTCNMNQKVEENLRDAQLDPEMQDITTNFCQICENDHQQQYVSYKLYPGRDANIEDPNQQDVLEDGSIMYRLGPKEQQNHVLIDDFNGKKVRIKTYEITDDNREVMQIRLLFYQPCNDYACFFFVVFNQEIPKYKGSSSRSKKTYKRSYIILRRSKREMEVLFNTDGKNPLIHEKDDVLIIKSLYKLDIMKFNEIREFQFKQKVEMSYMSASTGRIQRDAELFTDIRLTFCKASDEKMKINFVPFVYQEYKTIRQNRMMIFDIYKGTIAEPDPINPSKVNQKYVYVDKQGFNCFSICRTSEIYEEKINDGSMLRIRQQAKYQLQTLYTEKLGRIHCQEFLITHDNEGANQAMIGQKQILFSKKLIQDVDWQYLQKTQSVPFYDAEGRVKGCQLVLQKGYNEFSHVNLQEQDINNIYTYKSDVVLVGQRRFKLKGEDPEQYVLVVSALLRKKIIELNLFERSEAYQVLRDAQTLLMGMRIPDLSYIVLNSFKNLQQQDFFKSQALLLGKTIADMSLSDAESMQDALGKWETQKLGDNGSMIEMIASGDQVRRDVFREVSFYPKVMILNQDFNNVGTAMRAMRFNSFKSLKIMLEYLFDTVNTFDYQQYLMTDLKYLTGSKQVNVNDFFSLSEQERKSKDHQGFCNMEITFQNVELPVFSDMPNEYFTRKEFKDFHDIERELGKHLMEKDARKANREKKYPQEHSYIDFKHTIIGEKIRKYCEGDYNKIEFNDLYYATWIIESGENNQTFFLQESIQKFIDYQWSRTQKVLRSVFWMYVWLYCVPISTTLFLTGSEQLHTIMLSIAIIPAVILFGIECVQFRYQGLTYLQGWSLVDIAQFIIFATIQYLKWNDREDDERLVPAIPELKVLLLLLAFLKLLFFIRVFEEYGFLVQMIMYCVRDLFPFMVAYFTLVLIFSICFTVLGTEIDAEVVDAGTKDWVDGVFLDYEQSEFQLMVLQVFRTSIGELSMPRYEGIKKDPDSYFKTLNIALIWTAWFLQSFFMLVVMMNFLIAVISETYQKISAQRKIIDYRNKSELNEEAFIMMSAIMKFPVFRVVVFSTNSQQDSMDDDQVDEVIQQAKKHISKEMNEVKRYQDQLNKGIEVFMHGQQKLVRLFSRTFESFDASQEQMDRGMLRRDSNARDSESQHQVASR